MVQKQSQQLKVSPKGKIVNQLFNSDWCTWDIIDSHDDYLRAKHL